MKYILFISTILFPVFAFVLNHDFFSAVILIVWLVLLIPLDIVTVIDRYRTTDKDNILTKQGLLLTKVLILCLGLCSIIIGASIIVWVLYNIFIERLPEYSGPRTICGGFGIGPSLCAYGMYLLRLAFNRGRSKTANKING